MSMSRNELIAMIKHHVEFMPNIESIVVNPEQLKTLAAGERNLNHLTIDGKTYKLKVYKI